MIHVDATTLCAIAPRFRGARAERQAEIVAAIGPVLAETLARWRIDRRLRIAHFLAQTCHESAGFRTTEEFASGAAYEGRADLGNTEPGDGTRFKGRGLIQLTGRANYRRASEELGMDLLGTPELAAEPVTSLTVACWYWTAFRNINPAADRDDLIRVTRLVNGGSRGLAPRRQYLARAKLVLARRIASEIIAADDRPVLHRGSRGEAVADLQAMLAARRLRLAVDGEFGPATELAIRTWQESNGLVPDGIVGSKTWAVLAGKLA